MKRSLLPALLVIQCPLPTMAAAAPGSADIIVYGGTSGGVAAAIQAKRMGKSVILIEPTPFLGGLTTGGLGATDIGHKGAIGGLSREFYHRIWQHYQNDGAWTRQPKSQPAGEETRWTFEPHVATKVYNDWIRETGVTVVFGERLDLKNGVKKEGARITQIVMESGAAFTGKVFIDAGYEGDLMGKAGVSYHVGREANSVYGETLNGVQTARALKHQFTHEVDPYVVPGDPKSGVLPGIQLEPAGPDGSGDRRVQAYNYRLCTTDVAENRVAWPKPANYDPLRFELLLRNGEAGDLRKPWNPVWMPNRKTDTNNNFAISTDNLGMNYDYPEGDYATRARIVQEHKDYTQGLMWTLANSPRVPESVRSEFQRLGLAADEFTDSGNWPRQLYIREARRMVSDYVMTEKNCLREEVVEDSVGMGAYNMDSHNVRRHLTADGKVRNEGDIQVGSKPYPISYRSLRPKASECVNLLAPLTLSASHIAFGSIRMEPVFMVLGQSSATAAALAIEDGTTVQKVDAGKLKARLLADHQVLDFIPAAKPGKTAAGGIPLEKLPGIVVDDTAAVLSGFQHRSTSAAPFAGEGYAHDGHEPAGKSPQTAVFKTTLPAAGKYAVGLAWSANPNRATNVPVTVTTAAGPLTVTVNQRKPAAENGLFFPLGTFDLPAGAAAVEISNAGADGFVVIDAVQWLKRD
ncbi:MAG: FAD-dependent oxidoreductase [Verrucomicrobiota bacterium]